jgi:hypothetical protein
MADDFGVSFREIRLFVESRITELQRQKKSFRAHPETVGQFNDAIAKLEDVSDKLREFCCSQESCPAREYMPPDMGSYSTTRGRSTKKTSGKGRKSAKKR